MGWIVFEAMLALAVMLAVVWWTFRSRREPDVAEPDSADRDVAAPGGTVRDAAEPDRTLPAPAEGSGKRG